MKMPFSVGLLVLHLFVSPWYLPLISNCFTFTVEYAPRFIQYILIDGQKSFNFFVASERLSVDNGKKSQVGVCVWPCHKSAKLSRTARCCLATLCLSTWVSHLAMRFCTIFAVARHLTLPSTPHLNQLEPSHRPSYLVPHTASSLSFDVALNIDRTEFQTNLVRFPRIRIMFSSFASVISAEKDYQRRV